MRCVLVTRTGPLTHALQVWNGKRPICTVPVRDPDHAAVIAEHLWMMFVDSVT